MQPLTHHDILALVEPFTRSGRQLDLPASDRIKRSLVFKSKPSGDPATAVNPALTDTLALDCPGTSSFVLRRTVTHPAGLVATLVIEGSDTASLLASVDAIDPQPLFRSGDGWLMAYSYRLEPAPSAAPPTSSNPVPGRTTVPAMVLTSGVVQAQGLTMHLKMPTVTGYPAELEITANAAIELPDDLLQVLGRDWGRLSQGPKNWSGAMEVRGKEPDRSRLAQDKLERAARHLAETLAQSPASFEKHQVAARWRVVARRSVPMLIVLALVLAALAVPYLGIEQNSVYRMLIFNAPPLLLLWGFSLREMPRFELPRPPRPIRSASWWPVKADVPQVMPSGQPGTAAAAPGNPS